MIILQKMWNWLVNEWQWPKAALFCGVMMILLLTALLTKLGLMYFLIAMTLPMYMVHQFEEHYNNRFCLMLNEKIGRGKVVLTPKQVFWINSLWVWALSMVTITLAFLVNPLIGLIPVYFLVLNGILHCLQAIRFRSSNPGLFTSLIVFLPVGGYTIYMLSELPDNCWQYQALGIGVAVIGHAAILLQAGLHILSLKRSAQQP